jgi:predicted ATPase
LAQSADPASGDWRVKALHTFRAAAEQFEALGAAYDLHMAQATLSQLESEAIVKPSVSATADQSGTLPEGERRMAALVWVTLSPPPGADEEAVFETLALAVPALAIIAQEQQGRVVRRQDGLTVIFGAPTAYEDDPERAVRAAWDMLRYLEKSAQEKGSVPLACRVAVSQGEVVAGHIGSHVHKEFAVHGEPLQAAQQVAEVALPGRVWVTEAVRATTQRLFVYRPVRAAIGDLAHLAVAELVGLREQPDPARGLLGLKARLIGRETPLKAMQDLAEELRHGLGGLVWIEGEPGIGKSRLLQEFAGSLAAIPFPGPPTAGSAAGAGDPSGYHGDLVWSGRCSPQKSGQAFALFADLFAQAFSLQPTDTPDQMRAHIQQVTQSWPRNAQVARPYLEVLLGVQPGGLEGERVANLKPEQLRQQIFVAMRRLFKSMADEHPLVLILDDLHWVDPMSAELLQFLLPMVTSTPILFVCAQRRQGADSPNDRLVRMQDLIPTQTLRLALGRLTLPESETLLGELLPRVALPARLRSVILERSEGNPYFIEEYMRVLIEQGYVQRRPEGWALDPGQDLEDIPLPSSLDTLIRSRIDALPPELKQLLQCAAVIGVTFEADLLESISDLPNVRGALARLESRLLVGREFETGRWQFAHSLIEAVAYHTMLKARRREIHLKVAQVLEARWAGAEAEHAETLAYHYSRAGQSAQALTYLVLAGERAAARSANEEAKTYFEEAISYLNQVPEHAPALKDAEPKLHWQIVAGLGDVYRAIGQYSESKAILEEGLSQVEKQGVSSSQKAGMHRRLGETAQKRGELDAAYEQFGEALSILDKYSDPQAQTEVARVLTGLAWIHFVRGHFDQARATCEASLVYAQNAGALSELAAAENLLGGIYYHQSEWKAALHHTTRAMVLREQMGYTWGVAATLSNLGILAVSAGDWSKARSFFERSLALRPEMGDVEGMAIVHNNLGMLARDQGDLGLAEFHFRESLGAAALFKIAFHVANAGIGLAQVLLWKGELGAAQEAIQASLNQAQEIGAEDMLAEIYRTQAEIWLARSEGLQARSAAEQSTALAAQTGNRSLEAAAWRVISEIELQQGDLTAARQAVGRARQALTGGTDELEAGRLAAQAGRIHLQAGQVADAEAELRVAQEIFMRLGAGLDLGRVEQSLKAPASWRIPTAPPGVTTYSPIPDS